MLWRQPAKSKTGYIDLLYRLYWSVVQSSLICWKCSIWSVAKAECIILLYRRYWSVVQAFRICSKSVLIFCTSFINLLFRFYRYVMQAFSICCTGFINLLCTIYISVVQTLICCTSFFNLSVKYDFYWAENIHLNN